MANHSPARHAVTFVSSVNIPYLAVTLLSMLLIAVACKAQAQNQTPATPDPNAAQTTAAAPSNVAIPAGTRLALVLTSPIMSKSVHRGDLVYAQMTAPVPVGNSVAIPAGTFVQGKVDKLTRNGSRAEMLLQSVSVMFADGYVANVAGPLNMETDEGTA